MQWEQGGNVGTHSSCVRSSELQAYSTWLLGQTHELYIPTTAGIINLSTRFTRQRSTYMHVYLADIVRKLGFPSLVKR